MWEEGNQPTPLSHMVPVMVPCYCLAYLMRLIIPLTLRRCAVIALPRALRAVRFLPAIDFLLTIPAFEAERGLLMEIRTVCPFFPPIFRLMVVVLRPFFAFFGAELVELRAPPFLDISADIHFLYELYLIRLNLPLEHFFAADFIFNAIVTSFR